MEIAKKFKLKLFDDLGNAIEKPVSSAAQKVKTAGDRLSNHLTGQINDKLLPAASEAKRLGLNGYHSLEDATLGGVNLTREAGKSTVQMAKSIKEDPGMLLDNARAVASQAKAGLVDVKDFSVDAYERRSEIMDEAKTSLMEGAQTAGQHARYAVSNPLATLTHAKDHGVAIVSGAVSGALDIRGHFNIGRQDFIDGENRIKLQSAEHKTLTGADIIPNFNLRQGSEYLDAILLGGDILHAALAARIPADILLAYQMSMPQKALEMSFKEYVLGLEDSGSAASIPWLVSKIKGKLFEIQYVDYLNANGVLPDGFHAEMAELANQPGWDIRIIGPDGIDLEYLQLKATSSVQYIKDALERYPDIHVVTTNEVYSDLVMRGYEDQVSASDISNAHLVHLSGEAIDKAHEDFGAPSLISIALIAFTSYRVSELSHIDRSKLFGERSGKYAMAYFAGQAVTVAASGGITIVTTAAAMLASTLTQAVFNSGKHKIEKYNAMQELIKNNETLLSRLREQRQ